MHRSVDGPIESSYILNARATLNISHVLSNKAAWGSERGFWEAVLVTWTWSQ